MAEPQPRKKVKVLSPADVAALDEALTGPRKRANAPKGPADVPAPALTQETPADIYQRAMSILLDEGRYGEAEALAGKGVTPRGLAQAMPVVADRIAGRGKDAPTGPASARISQPGGREQAPGGFVADWERRPDPGLPARPTRPGRTGADAARLQNDPMLRALDRVAGMADDHWTQEAVAGFAEARQKQLAKNPLADPDPTLLRQKVLGMRLSDPTTGNELATLKNLPAEIRATWEAAVARVSDLTTQVVVAEAAGMPLPEHEAMTAADVRAGKTPRGSSSFGNEFYPGRTPEHSAEGLRLADLPAPEIRPLAEEAFPTGRRIPMQTERVGGRMVSRPAGPPALTAPGPSIAQPRAPQGPYGLQALQQAVAGWDPRVYAQMIPGRWQELRNAMMSNYAPREAEARQQLAIEAERYAQSRGQGLQGYLSEEDLWETPKEQAVRQGENTRKAQAAMLRGEKLYHASWQKDKKTGEMKRRLNPSARYPIIDPESGKTTGHQQLALAGKTFPERVAMLEDEAQRARVLQAAAEMGDVLAADESPSAAVRRAAALVPEGVRAAETALVREAAPPPFTGSAGQTPQWWEPWTRRVSGTERPLAGSPPERPTFFPREGYALDMPLGDTPPISLPRPYDQRAGVPEWAPMVSTTEPAARAGTLATAVEPLYFGANTQYPYATYAESLAGQAENQRLFDEQLRRQAEADARVREARRARGLADYPAGPETTRPRRPSPGRALTADTARAPLGGRQPLLDPGTTPVTTLDAVGEAAGMIPEERLAAAQERVDAISPPRRVAAAPVAEPAVVPQIVEPTVVPVPPSPVARPRRPIVIQPPRVRTPLAEATGPFSSMFPYEGGTVPVRPAEPQAPGLFGEDFVGRGGQGHLPEPALSPMLQRLREQQARMRSAAGGGQAGGGVPTMSSAEDAADRIASRARGLAERNRGVAQNLRDAQARLQGLPDLRGEFTAMDRMSPQARALYDAAQPGMTRAGMAPTFGGVAGISEPQFPEPGGLFEHPTAPYGGAPSTGNVAPGYAPNRAWFEEARQAGPMGPAGRAGNLAGRAVRWAGTPGNVSRAVTAPVRGYYGVANRLFGNPYVQGALAAPAALDAREYMLGRANGAPTDVGRYIPFLDMVTGKSTPQSALEWAAAPLDIYRPTRILYDAPMAGLMAADRGVTGGQVFAQNYDPRAEAAGLPRFVSAENPVPGLNWLTPEVTVGNTYVPGEAAPAADPAIRYIRENLMQMPLNSLDTQDPLMQRRYRESAVRTARHLQDLGYSPDIVSNLFQRATGYKNEDAGALEGIAMSHGGGSLLQRALREAAAPPAVPSGPSFWDRVMGRTQGPAILDEVRS